MSGPVSPLPPERPRLSDEWCEQCRHAAHNGECMAPTLRIDKAENTQTVGSCACGANAWQRAQRRRVQRAEARRIAKIRALGGKPW